MDDIAVKYYIRRAVKASRIFRCLPFKWHSKTGQMTFDPSLKNRILFLLHICLFWSYLCYLGVRALCFTYSNSPDIKTSKKTEAQYVAVGYLVVLLFQLCSLMSYGQHHILINRYLLFQQRLKKEWNSSKREFKCLSVSKFCSWYARLSVINPFSNVLNIWGKPTAANLITAAIPNVEAMAKWKLSPFAIIQFFLAATPAITMYFYLIFITAVTCDISNKLELMR